jgi:predicted GTPase
MDLVSDKKKHIYYLNEQLQRELPHLDYIPTIQLSVVQNQQKFFNVLFKTVEKGSKNTLFRVPTSGFNQFISELKSQSSCTNQGGKRANIYYGAQVSVNDKVFTFCKSEQIVSLQLFEVYRNSIRRD